MSYRITDADVQAAAVRMAELDGHLGEERFYTDAAFAILIDQREADEDAVAEGLEWPRSS